MVPFHVETPRPASATVTVPAPVARAAPESQLVPQSPLETRASAPSVPTFFRGVRRRWVAVG